MSGPDHSTHPFAVGMAFSAKCCSTVLVIIFALHALLHHAPRCTVLCGMKTVPHVRHALGVTVLLGPTPHVTLQ